MQNAQVKKGLGAMGTNGSILKLVAILTALVAASGAFAASITLNGAGTAKAGDTITFVTDNTWLGTTFNTTGNATEIRYLNAGGSLVAGIPLTPANVAGWSFVGGAIIGGSFVLPAQLDGTITQVELAVTSNAEGPIISTNRRAVDVVAPTAQTTSIANLATIGGTYSFVIQDSGVVDNDVIGAGVVVQIDQNGANNWQALTNQTPGAWTGGTGSTVTVNFDAIDANNNGFIEEVTAVANGSVSIRVVVSDPAGNSAILGPFTGITVDALAPTVLSITTMTTSTIRVIFNETVSSGATTAPNYTVSGGNFVSSAALSTTNVTNDTVTLTLGVVITSSATPTVTVTNVRDLGTNVVSANAPNGTAATDGIKPTLLSAKQNTYAATNTITLEFDEPIQAGVLSTQLTVGAGDISNIGLLTQNPGGAGTQFFQFNNATANTPLVAGTTVAATVAILDIAGNTANTVPVTLQLIPSVQSAAYTALDGAGQYNLTVTFSKTINRTSFVNALAAGHLRLSQADGTTGQFIVDSTNSTLVTATDAAAMVLKLMPSADASLVTFNGLGLIKLQLTAGTVSDGTLLAIAATGTDITVGYTADAAAPLLDVGNPIIQRKLVAVTGTTVDVTFDDYITQASATANVAQFLLNGATPATSATVLTTGSLAGYSVRLVFAGGVDTDAFDGDGVDDLDIGAGVFANNNGQTFAGTTNQVIATDAAATSTITQGAAPAATTLVAATVHGTPANVFNFTVTDAGGDNLPTNFTSIVLDVEDTGAADFNAANVNITWRLTGGSLGAAVTGVIGGVSPNYTLTFSGLAQSVANGTAANYAVSVQIAAAAAIVDGAQFRIDRNATNTDLVSSGGSTFVAAVAFNGSTITYDVVATKLSFVTVDGGGVGGFPTSTAFTADKSVNVDFGNWVLEFVDANNMRDLGANGAGARVTVSNSAGVAPAFAGTIANPASGQVDPVSGVATFNAGSAIRFNTTANDISLAFATIYAAGGAIANATTTSTFDVRPDTNSTLTENTSPATIGDTGTATTVWVLNLADIGTADALATVLNSLTINATIAGTAGLNLNNFVWTLIADDDGAGGGAARGAVTAAGPAATSGTLVFTAAPLISVANGTTGTLTLQVNTVNVTASTVLDEVNFNFTVANSVAFAFETSGDLVFPQNSSLVTNGTSLNNTNNTEIDVVASALAVVTHPQASPANEVVAVAFSVAAQYINARGNRDLDVDTDVLTATRSNGGNPVVGTGNATNGLATFNVTFAAPGDISNTLRVDFTDDAGGTVNLSGSPVQSNAFLLRNSNDADSTLTDMGVGAGFISGIGGAQNVWTVRLSDTGLSDGKTTVLTGVSILIGMAGGGTNDVADFAWTIVDGGTTYNGTPNNGTNTVTFSSMTITAPGTDTTGGSVDFVLRAAPSATMTDRSNVDGMTINFQITAATTAITGTSITTAIPFPVAPSANVTIQVAATRLSFNPTANNTIANPLSAGTSQNIDVWYTDANGNLDKGATGGSFIVTAARSDSFSFFPDPNPSLEGGANDDLTITVAAVAGISSFTAADAIALAGRASPSTTITVNFTDSTTFLTGTGSSATPLLSNAFILNSLQEAAMTAGATAEDAAVGSVGAAANLLDFTLTDSGNDDINTRLTQITLDMSASTSGAGNVSGMLADVDIRLPIQGSLTAAVTGTVVGTTVVFNLTTGGNTGIVITDGGNATYQFTLQAKSIKFVTLRDGDVFRASLSHASSFTTDPVTGRISAAAQTVSNVGMTMNVVASKLSWVNVVGNLPTTVREGDLFRDSLNGALEIEYVDANGNRDLGATDTITVFYNGITDGSQAAEVRANGVTNTLSAVAGLATFTNFSILDDGAGAGVGGLNKNIFFVDGAAGVLAGTGAFTSPNLTLGTLGTDVLRLSNALDSTFNLRAIDDKDTTFTGSTITVDVPVGGAEVEVFRVTFIDSGFSDNKATVVKELRFDVTLSGGGIDANNFDWRISSNGGGTFTSATAKSTNRISFVSGTSLFTVADSGNGAPTQVQLRLYATALTTPGNINGKTAADNQTMTIALNPAAGVGGNGVVLDAGAAAFTGTSLSTGQATFTDPGNDTVRVTATQLVFASYNGGIASVTDHQLGVQGNAFEVTFNDAANNRDVDSNGAGFNITIARSDVVGGFNVTAGSVTPAAGVATFNLTFNTKRAGWRVVNQANQISLTFSQGALTNGTTNLFNVQSDATSTVSEVSAAAQLLDNNTFATVWTLNVNDLGSFDGLPTILDSIVIAGSATGGFDLTNFNWRASFNGGPNVAPTTVAAGTLTFAGPTLMTVANNTSATIVLQAQTGLITNSTTFDGITLDLTVSNATTVVNDATNSSTFAAFAAVNNSTNTVVNVVADRLDISATIYPGDGNTPNVPLGEERVNVTFTTEVFYENVNGNRDTGANGDVVTVVRSDGAGNINQGTSAAAVNGVASFSAANAINLANPANVTGTLYLTASDDPAGGAILGVILSDDTPTFILRTFDDANSRIEQSAAQAGNNTLFVMTAGTNTALELWSLDVTDLETSDPVPTIIEQLIFNVGIASAGTNTINDIEWTLQNATQTFVGAANTVAGTVTFQSTVGSAQGALVTAGDSNLATNGTPDTKVLRLFGRVKTPGNGGSVTDPANIDGAVLTISLGTIPAGPPTVYTDNNAANNEDSTSLNTAFAPVSAALTRTAGNVTVQVIATKVRELPAAMVTGLTRSANTAFALGAEYTDVNNYRDRDVTGDTLRLVREDGNNADQATNPLTTVVHPFKGAGVIISGATAVAANGVVNFTVNLGYPGFNLGDANHRLFFVDDNGGSIDLHGAEGAGQPYATGNFGLDGVNEATIAAGLGADSPSVSSTAAGPAVVVDFQIIDNGSDALSTDITQIVITIGGTAQANEGTWYLDGPDFTSTDFNGAANRRAVGVQVGNQVTFGNGAAAYNGLDTGALPIRVGDNTGTIAGLQSETYRVLFRPTQSALTTQDNQFWTVTVDSLNFTVDDVAGSGRQASVTVDNTGVGGLRYDVTATTLSFGALSGPAGAPTGTTVAGVAFGLQPDFRATDNLNNRDLDYNDTITATLTTNVGGSSISGTNPVAFTNGTAAFTNLSLNKVGTGYQFTFQSGSLPQLQSPNFNISAAAAAAAEISTQPATTVAGNLLATSPVVRLLDAFGNIATATVATTFTATITAPVGGSNVFDQNDTGNPNTFGTSAATRTANVGVGQSTATFNNLRINRAATGYALNFAATVNATPVSINSSLFNITPGAPASVSVSATFADPHLGNVNIGGVAPAGATAGAAFTTQPVAVLLDSLGNVRTNDSATQVVCTIVAPGGTYTGPNVAGLATNANIAGTLQGLNSQTVTVVNGIANFSGVGLRIDQAANNYTLRFADVAAQHATPANSTITVLPAAGTLIQIEEQPVSATAGTAIAGANTAVPAATIRLSIRDSYGNVRTTDSSTVISAAIGANPGSTTLQGTTSQTAVNGVVNFPTTSAALGLNIQIAATGYTMNFSSGGLATATSTAFNITPAASTNFVIVNQPTSINAGVAFLPVVTLQLKDAFGNNTTNDSTSVVRMTIANNPGLASLRLTTAIGTTVTQVDGTAASGIVTFNNVTMDKAANGYTLQFAGIVPVMAAVTSSAFNVNAGAPSQLAMAVQPGNTVAGVAISPAPQLQVRDQFGNHVTSDNTTTVTAAVGIDPNSLNTPFGGNTSATASAGTVTFTNLFITRTGVGYRADFTSGTVTGVNSNLFNITHAPAAAIQVTTQPGNTNTDSVIPGVPAIRLLDQYGNICTTDSATVVSVAIGTNPSLGGVLTGTLSKPVALGVASFANLNIDKKGTGFTLTFTGTSLTSAGTNTFNVVAGAPHHAVIATQPANGTAGTAFGQPKVEIYDLNDNLCDNNSTVNVTAAISANPGAATLSASSTTTIQVTAGVADWGLLPLANRLRIDRAANGYTLLFTATLGVTSVTSGTFNIGHAAASQLALTTQPNGATAGQAFNVQPVIEVRDAFNNRVTSDSISVVSVAFVLNGPGGATGSPLGNANGVLQGPPSQPVTAGIATFTLLRIDQAGVGYSLRFSSGALTVADSNAFNVNHAAPSQLVVTTQPAGAFGGAVFNTQPVVEIRDPFNNVATTSSLTVTGALGSDPTAGTSGFAGGPSLAATAGVVNFGNLAAASRFKINKAATGYTMTFSASGLPNATSALFNVLVGPAASIHVTTQPDSFRAVVGGVVQAFDTQPVVELRDLGGNKTVADNSTVVTAAIGLSAPVAGVPVIGGTLARTSVAGEVTWTDLSISVAGDFTIVFTAPGLTQAESDTFTLESGPLILQTIALDDHDNNGQVSARDRLLFSWDEELMVSSVPLVNTTGQLDNALGLANGTLGSSATAAIGTDGKSIWVTVGVGETMNAGTSTANPTTIRNTAGDFDVTPAPVAIGGPVTDVFAPHLQSLTINGGSPTVLLAGTYEIVATYSDDQINPTISIVAPGTNDVTSVVMTAVDAANPRVFSFSYEIGTANGTLYVDGPVSVSVSNANDARGNIAVDDVGLPYLFVVDTVAPAFASLAVTDADNCYRAGDTISVRAVMNEVGLSVQGFFGAADTTWAAPLTFTDNLDGSYSITTPALGALTSLEGNHTINVVATDVAGNSASFIVPVIVDNTAPNGLLSYNRPVANVPAGDLVISVSYNEDIYVRPTLSATFTTNTALNVVAGLTSGSVPGRSFSYTLSIPAGTMDSVTLSIGSAADCAGNVAASPLNNLLTVTGGAATLIANAGVDQVLTNLAVVTLNGTNSVGATGYAWTRVSGPQTVSIANATSSIATFSATSGGDYVFELEVTNGTDVATDVVTISIPNFLPEVTVGADINTDADEVDTLIGGNFAKVGLSGTVLDRNGDNIVTQWVLVDGPSDGNLSVVSPASLTSALAVTGAAMVGGVYEYELRAWDPAGLLTSTFAAARLRFVVVSATRIAPAAHAGLDATVNVGTIVTLNGNESSDPNSAVPQFPALLYSWTLTQRPAGSGASISNATSKTPTLIPDLAGVYVAELRVTDIESLKSGTDTVVITAIAASAGGSQAGMARAQVVVTTNDTDSNGAINVGESVTMDASNSPTADPTAVLTFNWVQLSGPVSVVLPSANGAVQTFTATIPGNYVFVVTPNDGVANGIPATVRVTVAAAGQIAPVAMAGIDPADDPNGDKRVYFVPSSGVDLNFGNPSIELTGAGSTTSAGVTYQWRQTVGPTVGIVNANSLVMSFVPRLSRVYSFELTVTNAGVSSTATISMVIDTFHPILNPVGNVVPTAIASAPNGGSTILTTAGRQVAMLGAATDGNDDNANLIYTWVQLTGAPVVLIGANTANPTFVPPVPGTYTFALYVDDGFDIGEPSLLSVQVGPFVPAPTDPGAVGSSGCSLAEGSNTGMWALIAALLALASFAAIRRRRA